MNNTTLNQFYKYPVFVNEIPFTLYIRQDKDSNDIWNCAFFSDEIKDLEYRDLFETGYFQKHKRLFGFYGYDKVEPEFTTIICKDRAKSIVGIAKIAVYRFKKKIKEDQDFEQQAIEFENWDSAEYDRNECD